MRQFIIGGLLALAASTAFGAEHAVEIKGMKFEPASLTVAAGDTVTFTNADNAPHTATAADGSFDTGRLNKGDSATVSVTAGTHDYSCNFHSMMKGSLTAE